MDAEAEAAFNEQFRNVNLDHVWILRRYSGNILKWFTRVFLGEVYNKCLFKVTLVINGKEFSAVSLSLNLAKNVCAKNAIKELFVNAADTNKIDDKKPGEENKKRDDESPNLLNSPEIKKREELYKNLQQCFCRHEVDKNNGTADSADFQDLNAKGDYVKFKNLEKSDIDMKKFDENRLGIKETVKNFITNLKGSFVIYEEDPKKNLKRHIEGVHSNESPTKRATTENIKVKTDEEMLQDYEDKFNSLKELDPNVTITTGPALFDNNNIPNYSALVKVWGDTTFERYGDKEIVAKIRAVTSVLDTYRSSSSQISRDSVPSGSGSSRRQISRDSVPSGSGSSRPQISKDRESSGSGSSN